MKTSIPRHLLRNHTSGSLAAALLLWAGQSATAGINSYGVFKGRQYLQESASSVVAKPVESHGTFIFVHTAAEEELTLGSVQVPGQPFPTVLGNSSDDVLLWEHSEDFASQAALDSAAPNGSYAFSLVDGDFNFLNASLTVGGNTYPAAPGISNFAAAQAIDPAQPLTVQWTPPAGLGANDFVVVEVWGDSGNVRLLASPFPWDAGSLPGTTASFTIPAGTLTGTDLELDLGFIKVTSRDTTSIEGATGYSGYFTFTQVPLKLAGGGGGDTTPPALVSSVPASFATGVPTDTSLVLTFSEPMQASQQVNWVNVPNAASITYTWSNGGQTLTCSLPGGFPANTMVIWALTLNQFKDLAGNTLSGGVPGGTFTTANSNPEPCVTGLEERKNFFFVAKEVAHVQSSAADPVPGGDPVATFGSFFSPGAGTTATAASVRLPTGEVRNLTGFMGNYFISATAASEAALNTAFPAGNYTGTVTIGGSTGNLALPMVAAPSVPKCANYAAAQAVDPAAAFTLQWNAFAGATGNDRIEVIVQDGTGQTVFQAPNECAQPPIPLTNTATQITLPANLLQSGKTYEVELRFMKVSGFASQTGPAYQGATGFTKTTHFTLKTTGGSSDSIVIKAFRLPTDGRFEVDVQAGPSQTVFLEAWVNFATWEPVNGTLTGANGLATLKDQRLQLPASQVYRVRTQ